MTGESPRRPGEYKIVFHAANPKGKSSRPFKLIVGDTLALTPPMGWSSWYMAFAKISDKLMRDQADADGVKRHGRSRLRDDQHR